MEAEWIPVTAVSEPSQGQTQDLVSHALSIMIPDWDGSPKGGTWGPESQQGLTYPLRCLQKQSKKTPEWNIESENMNPFQKEVNEKKD